VSFRTEHAEMHNGGRHKIKMCKNLSNCLKRRKTGMNLTIISHFQSICVTRRLKQAVGIMEYYDSIICDELGITLQQKAQ